MGTGGLLCYTYKYCKDKIFPSNIYGCDIEKDTIKFGVASLMLTTNEYNENIIRCNSLIENPYLFENKKFDIVFTNPPFGTKNNYKDLKNNFESYKKLNYKDSSLKFEDIYPINTNKGTNLFIQLVVYLLKENGICAIVLPDGELMTSNNNSNIEIRKFILNKCKILKIINVEGGTFTNTGIKTKVLFFQKGNFDNYNQEVEFVEINSNSINSLGLEKLNSTFQFNISKKEEITSYNKDIELKTLGEVCEDIITSKNIPSSDRVDGTFRFFTCSREESTHNEFHYDGTFIIHGSRGSTIKESIFITNNEKFAIGTSMFISKIKNENENEIVLKYIYYYLRLNQFIFNEYINGSAIPMISKTNYYDIKIPIPSLEQQKEIVEYLDLIYEKNIKSSNEKIEEIKKLNEEYLKLNLNYNKKIENKTLGELCEFQNGKGIKKDSLIEGEYPVIGGGQNPMGFHNKYNTNENVILCSSSGAYAGFISKYNKKVWASDCFSIIPKDNSLNNNYLYYLLKIQQDKIYKTQSGSAQPHVYSKDLQEFKILIPTLEKQKEIVDYLDFNNNLINNLNKEIENNKKQGETFFNMFLSD
jgi:restriction endonuclease S subunit